MDTNGQLHILHIEDDKLDAELIRRVLQKSDLNCRITLALTRDECLDALQEGGVDVILSDSRGYDFDGREVLRLVQRHRPGIPFLFVSGSLENKNMDALRAEGAAAWLVKSDLGAIAPAIRYALEGALK